MRKKSLSILFALLMVGAMLLTACGGDDTDSSASSDTAAENELAEIALPGSVSAEVSGEIGGEPVGSITIGLPEGWEATPQENPDMVAISIANTSEISDFNNLQPGQITGILNVLPMTLDALAGQVEQAGGEIPEEFALPSDPATASLEDYTHFMMWALSAGGSEAPPMTVRSRDTYTSDGNEVAIEIGSVTSLEENEVVDYVMVLRADDSRIYMLGGSAAQGEMDQFKDELVAIVGSISFTASE